MAYDDVKVCVRSLLISSPKPLSILEIQKDYFLQEGKCIPYDILGFNSVIELLQNMKDVLIVSTYKVKSIFFLKIIFNILFNLL